MPLVPAWTPMVKADLAPSDLEVARKLARRMRVPLKSALQRMARARFGIRELKPEP